MNIKIPKEIISKLENIITESCEQLGIPKEKGKGMLPEIVSLLLNKKLNSYDISSIFEDKLRKKGHGLRDIEFEKYFSDSIFTKTCTIALYNKNNHKSREKIRQKIADKFHENNIINFGKDGQEKLFIERFNKTKEGVPKIEVNGFQIKNSITVDELVTLFDIPIEQMAFGMLQINNILNSKTLFRDFLNPNPRHLFGLQFPDNKFAFLGIKKGRQITGLDYKKFAKEEQQSDFLPKGSILYFPEYKIDIT